MDINIRLLSKDDIKDDFNSSSYELNHFFKNYASQNQFKHYIGSTYIAIVDATIVGFITISASSIRVDEYENKDLNKLPSYPLPVLRVSRLAIDTKYQNMGIDKELLKFIMTLSLEQQKKFGCIGLIVDAKKDSESYYEQFGFDYIDIENGLIDIRPYTKTMYLSTKTILKAIKY